MFGGLFQEGKQTKIADKDSKEQWLCLATLMTEDVELSVPDKTTVSFNASSNYRWHQRLRLHFVVAAQENG